MEQFVGGETVTCDDDDAENAGPLALPQEQHLRRRKSQQLQGLKGNENGVLADRSNILEKSPVNVPVQQKMEQVREVEGIRFSKLIGGSYYHVFAQKDTENDRICLKVFDPDTQKVIESFLEAPQPEDDLMDALKRKTTALVLRSAEPKAPKRRPPPAPVSETKDTEEILQMTDKKTQTEDFPGEKEEKDLSDELARLKLELMSLEQERDDFKQEAGIAKQELEAAVAECESVCKEMEDQHQKTLQDLSKSQTQLKVYFSQVEMLTNQQGELEDEISRLKAETEEKSGSIKLLKEEIEHFRAEIDAVETKNQNLIVDLQKDLGNMTESYETHKHYGVTMKAKCLEVKKRAEAEVISLSEECTALKVENKETLEEVEILKQKIAAVSSELSESKSEQAHSQNELASLGLENDSLKRSLVELQESYNVIVEERAALEKERDEALEEKRAALVVFEQQRKEATRAHKEEAGKLKIQFFDASETLKAKEAEVSELSGYVTRILDQQDALQAELCDSCKEKAKAILGDA